MEIEQAIKGKKNIIPIFINGFKMPEKSKLRESISEITDHNGIDCSMEYFDGVIKKLIRHLHSHPEDESLFVALEQLQTKAVSLRHPYFRKWSAIKINEFIYNNEEFFEGRNKTDPHAEDTFGVSGVKLTKKSLKALTAVNDYWQDGFVIEYLNRQKELVENGVTIDRVFVVDKNNMDTANEQMEYQKNLGINVYYIEKGNEFIDPEWLEEDYLIQDEELLVQIFCDSHKFNGEVEPCEHITMVPVIVQNKIERFNRIIERSKKF